LISQVERRRLSKVTIQHDKTYSTVSAGQEAGRSVDHSPNLPASARPHLFPSGSASVRPAYCMLYVTFNNFVVRRRSGKNARRFGRRAVPHSVVGTLNGYCPRLFLDRLTLDSTFHPRMAHACWYINEPRYKKIK
jgi:hypothetical protein